jgi:hypothetical protein
LNTVGRAERRLLPSLGLSPTHPLKLYVQNGLKKASHIFFNEEIVKNQYWLFKNITKQRLLLASFPPSWALQRNTEAQRFLARTTNRTQDMEIY